MKQKLSIPKVIVGELLCILALNFLFIGIGHANSFPVSTGGADPIADVSKTGYYAVNDGPYSWFEISTGSSFNGNLAINIVGSSGCTAGTTGVEADIYSTNTFPPSVTDQLASPQSITALCNHQLTFNVSMSNKNIQTAANGQMKIIYLEVEKVALGNLQPSPPL